MPTGSDSGKWLECNGQSVDSATYPKLAALMSNVPNYQGVFLRGYGSQSYTDGYGTVIYQSLNLNMIQGDTIRNIKGSSGAFMMNNFLPNGNQYGYVTGAFQNPSSSDGWGNSHEGAQYPGMGLNLDVSLVVPTSNENRPINMAVRYLIKAK